MPAAPSHIEQWQAHLGVKEADFGPNTYAASMGLFSRVAELESETVRLRELADKAASAPVADPQIAAMAANWQRTVDVLETAIAQIGARGPIEPPAAPRTGGG